MSDCVCSATKKFQRSDQPYSHSARIAANTAPRTAAIEPTAPAAAAPGNGTVEPPEPLGFTPLGEDPEGAGALPAAVVVGKGGVAEVEALLVVAALVSSGVELATGGLDATASEVAVATGAVVEAGAALAVAAHPHTAAADD